MAEAQDLVAELARQRYGSGLIHVDADSITLSDGSQLFLAKVLAELAPAPAADWSTIAEGWLAAFDLFRQRISMASTDPSVTKRPH